MFTLVYFDVVGELRLESLSLPSSSQCSWCLCFFERKKRKRKLRHASAQRNHKDLWSILRITWLHYSRRLRESESFSCCFMKHLLYVETVISRRAMLLHRRICEGFVSCKPLLQTHFVTKTDRRGSDVLFCIRSTNLVGWFLALPNGDVTRSFVAATSRAFTPPAQGESSAVSSQMSIINHICTKHKEPVRSKGLPSS